MGFFTADIREWFWDIFFPSHCLGCGETLQYSKHEIFCPICRLNIFISDTHLVDQHRLKKRLCSDFPFHLVLSKYRFPNHSALISNMIYGLKYQNLRYIGLLEGAEYGEVIGQLLLENEVSALIPTPLHWRKELKRGYNQSLEFTLGLAQTTHLPVYSKIIRRVKNTESQTQLNKTERIQNMKNAFQARLDKTVLNSEKPPHFLLIDDVATSGVTLAEMARTLKTTYHECRISVCTLAYKDY